MADITTTVFSALGIGTVVAALLTFLGNRWIKTREEEIDMAKKKMDVVMSTLPTYGLLAGTHSGLYHESVKRKDNQNQDKRLLFSYVCDILRLDRIIVYEQGGIVLNDLDAERIISDFGYELYTALFKKFNKEHLSKMRKLTGKEIAFHEFCDNITKGESKELYDRFVEWYTTLKEDELINLENKSKWLYELLIFELNTIFSRWYKREPRFSDDLSDDLQKYLLKAHEQDTTMTNDPNKQQLIKRYCKKLTKYEMF